MKLTIPTRRVVIWDLDGTLVDSRADIVSAANAALIAVGRSPLPTSTISGYVGDGVAKLIERLVPDADAAHRAACLVAFEGAYAACCCATTACYPGIVPALAQLQTAGWMQAVATNKADAYVAPILKACGIADFFAAVRGGDGKRKPDPWQLVDIQRELNTAPGWMIGDHHTDLIAGKSAGFSTIFCTWGLGHRDGMVADHVVEHPAQILSFILGAVHA